MTFVELYFLFLESEIFRRKMTISAVNRTTAKIYNETSINATGEGPPPYGTVSVNLGLQ